MLRSLQTCPTRIYCVLLASLSFLCSISAYEVTSWHMLRYHLPQGSSLTSFSGDMLIPPLKRVDEGTYYVWPGLETPEDNGIYQNVLGGNSSGLVNGGAWSYFSGFCCENPVLPWGASLKLFEGDTIHFSNVKNNSWKTVSEMKSTGKTVTSRFPALDVKTFDQAVFAIELYNLTWDFGPVKFSNIVMTSTGQDASWCNNTPEDYSKATNYSITGVRSSIAGGIVSCYIDTLILENPQDGSSTSSSSPSSRLPRSSGAVPRGRWNILGFAVPLFLAFVAHI